MAEKSRRSPDTERFGLGQLKRARVLATAQIVADIIGYALRNEPTAKTAILNRIPIGDTRFFKEMGNGGLQLLQFISMPHNFIADCAELESFISAHYRG